MGEKIKVAVLMGGQSAERQVSLKTGTQILNSLDATKYDVFALDTATGTQLLPGQTVRRLEGSEGNLIDGLTQLPALPTSGRPDVVFIALHGPGGEDGTVQGFLEMLGIRYTGSGILASALAMDKVRCKAFFATGGIRTPAGITLGRANLPRRAGLAQEITEAMGFPVIVKPNRQGSSFGTRVVNGEAELAAALDDAFAFDDTALIEERIAGVEITVAVLGNSGDLTALPPVEIVSKDGFFDYTAKYSVGAEGATEICPARISPESTSEAQQVAIRCHELLGCRGMSRTDMFVTARGCVVLETNTIPGMTETSLLPRAAKAAGIGFAQLLDRLIAYALEPVA